ncbi:hypothetical protein B0H13DRAFT_2363989 [Mycena leptocephala]|nr:hypothetical protein B0H13DRAFT_2363989 [Mycena leptocephala]
MSRTQIDLNALPPLDEIKGGSVNGLKKAELLSLAKALDIELPGNSKVKELKKLVLDALGSQKFATDSRFQKFTVYRPSTTGGAATKNSADKDKQDAAAQKQDTIAPSGKLLQQEVKADPAPKFKHLGQPGSDPNKKKEPGADDASVSSLSSIIPSEDEHEDDADKPHKSPSTIDVDLPPSHNFVAPDEVEAGLPIAVEFQGVNTHNHTIWILPSQRAAIPLFKAEDGTLRTSLKKLIPPALAQLSPAKNDHFSKLSIGLDNGSTLSLGTVREFMRSQFPEVLELVQADSCQLHRKPDQLVCYIIWKAGTSPIIDIASSSQLKPFELAQSRKKPAARKKKGSGFKRFLNKVVGGHEDVGGHENGFPEVLDTVGKQLERWNVRHRAIAFCDENWKTGRRGKPYRVPAHYEDDENEEHRQFAKRPFTKKCLTTALGIGNSTVTSDRNLVTCPDIPYDPLAERWVKGDPDLNPKVKAKFDQMHRAEWFAHLEKAKADKIAADEAEAKEAAREERRKRRRAEVEPKKRRQEAEGSHGQHLAPSKRPHESDSSASISDSEEERRLKRKLKKIREKRALEEADNGEGKSRTKGKGKGKALSSDHLESSNSE